MGRFLVKATCESPLRLADTVTVKLDGAVVHMSDWTENDPAGPLHRGLFLDVSLNANDSKEAMRLAEQFGDSVVTLLAFAMSVGAGPVIAFIVYDYEPERRDRSVLQHLQLPVARPTRRFDAESFQPLWDAINQSPADLRERTLRAIAWFRKATLERYLFDQFFAMWNGLEVANPALKEKYNLPKERTLRSCPVCGAPVVTIPTGEGIKFALDRAGDRTLWSESRDRRIGIFHGTKPISELLNGIERLVSGGMDALRSGILDIAGVSEEKWLRFKRTPMPIPRPSRVRVEYDLLDATMEQAPLGLVFPHLQITNLEAAREWEGKVQTETATPQLKLFNYTGTWRAKHIEMVVDKDPDDPHGKLELRI